ncbi:hypothetical protein [Niallia sp. 03133]|uniref:hypothetical protein n=1 Tax=Niallia sp. 03133 TaxID=3458060 RepID=UPI004043C43D
MNWKKSALIIIIALFLVFNIGLLLKTKHSFDRSTYVHAWTKVKERDLVQKMDKKGLGAPLEKQSVYLDNSKGAFSGFLVKKGEFVEPNTPILAYTNHSAKKSTDTLQLEINQLEKEQSSLQTQISELKRLQTTVSSAASPTGDEDNNNNNNNNNNELLSTSIEQQILDKEQEMAKSAAAIEKNQALIHRNEEQLQDETEQSTISGYVASIKEDLTNPIITIVSDKQIVEGLLKEEERPKVKEGMDVVINGKNNKVYSGKVDYVSALPKDQASIKKESMYPFAITLNEQSKEIISGTHVDMQVITEKVLDAITLPKKSILMKERTNSIYTIENGAIAKKEVATGLYVDQYQQLKSGAKIGEIAIIPTVNKNIKAKTYITPIKVREWPNMTMENRRKKELLRYVLKGFL